MSPQKVTFLRTLIVLLLTMVLTACKSGPTDAECSSSWLQMEVGVSVADYDDYDEYVEAFEAAVGSTASLIVNREHAPDTVGYTLKECIQNGWDYRAASGLE